MNMISYYIPYVNTFYIQVLAHIAIDKYRVQPLDLVFNRMYNVIV
jgi:hypothetical protein